MSTLPSQQSDVCGEGEGVTPSRDKIQSVQRHSQTTGTGNKHSGNRT